LKISDNNSKEREQITIKRLEQIDQLEDLLKIWEYAYRESPATEASRNLLKEEKFRLFKENYTISVLEKDQTGPCAAAITYLMNQNIRGKVVIMGGVGGIAVDPESRRKGHTRDLLLHMFDYMHKEKSVVSTLYPFKESFYEKFGYVPLPSPQVYVIKTSVLSNLIGRDFGGSIERKQLDDSNLDEFYHFIEEKGLQTTHGFSTFTNRATRSRIVWGPEKYWVAYAVVNKKKVGAMVYLTKGMFECMKIRYFYHFGNSQAKYLLLQWVSIHNDQFPETYFDLPANDRLETWTLDSKFKIEQTGTPSHTGGMGRVINVATLSGIKIHSKEENLKFTATISDPQCEWNNGTFSFEVVEGLLQVNAIDSNFAQPFDLTIQGLSSLVFNGAPSGDLVYKHWGNPPKDIQPILDEIFPTVYPCIYERF